MATPTFNLPTSGSDPKRATKEGLEENINSIIQYLDGARIAGDDRGTEGFYNAGPWDASTGAFPTVRGQGGAVQNGDTFFVPDGGAGIVDGQPQFEVGQRIIALVDNPSSATYAGNWERANTIAILAPLTARVDTMPVNFDTVAALDAASLADIKALANATTGTAYIVVKDGGHRYSLDLAQSASSNWTTASGVEVTVLAGVDGSANVAAFAATGSGDETAIFEAAAGVAASAGGVVVIPLPAFTVSAAGADAQGCDIIGQDTSVTGYFENAGKMRRVKIGGIRQDRHQVHPAISYDQTKKLIRRSSDNLYLAFSPSTRGGYALLTMVNDVTTTNDSLAVTNSDQTQWRVDGILRCVEVLTGYLTASGSSGAWTAATLSTGVPAFTSGSAYNYTRSSTIGAYKEFTVTVPDDGYLSVGLLTGPTASPNVDISVDGEVIDPSLDTTNASSFRMVRTYTVKPGVRVVRVENKDASATGLNIFGINFSPLRDQRSDVDLDTYGYYRNSSFSDPISNASANDYAIWDSDASMWGGSYHGGETDFTESFYVDSQEVSLSNGDFVVGSTIEIAQSSTIDWSAVGGGEIYVQTRHTLKMGGYSLSVNFTGEVRARDYFTTLFGVSESFDTLTAPDHVDIPATVPDGTRYPLPLGNVCEFASASGDRLRIEHSSYDWGQIKEGGPFVWRVDGSYHKYYNAIVTSGDLTVNKIHAVNIVTMT